jgi:hypothetical protein
MHIFHLVEKLNFPDLLKDTSKHGLRPEGRSWIESALIKFIKEMYNSKDEISSEWRKLETYTYLIFVYGI